MATTPEPTPAARPAKSAGMTPDKTPDLRGVWRLCAWAGGAGFAVAVLLLTMQTDTATRRIRELAASVSQPIVAVAQIPGKPSESELEARAEAKRLEGETRRLLEAVQRLTDDREKLGKRLAAIEDNLSDITGAIRRQPTSPAASPLLPADKPLAALPPPPQISAPATVAAVTVPSVDKEVEAAAPGASDVAALIPLPPQRPGGAPKMFDEPADAPEATGSVTATEFGVDLGYATTMDGIRAHWTAMRANNGPLFDGLRGTVSTRERKPGMTEYRLVVGPFKNAAEAARLCARIPAGQSCRTAVYDGRRTALR